MKRTGPMRTLRLRRWTSALATLAILPVLAGCGRSSELTIVWQSDILTLDPNEKFEAATDTYAMNVFEPLLRVGREGYVPVLAQRWETHEGNTWRFYLREGVLFHDGTPLSAHDVVFSIERIRERPESELHPFLESVRSARALDDRTVEVISERPASLLPVLSFVYVLPKKAVQARPKEFFDSPIGSGAYRFVSWRPAGTLELSRWKGHWAPAPHFSRARFVHVEDDDALWTTARERRPAILIGASRRGWESRKGDSRFRLVSRLGMSVSALALNTIRERDNPLRDLRVRQALRAALDVEGYVKRVTGGQGFAATQYVTPDIVGYDPTLVAPPHRPGAARSALKDAGYPMGLNLTLNVQEGNRSIQDLLDQLLAEGIRVTPQWAPPQVFYERLLKCEGDLHVVSYICSTGDAAELLEGVFYRGGRLQGKTNFLGCGYENRDFDLLVDRAARALDPAERQQLMQAAMRKVVSDLPWIPIATPYDRYATTPGVVWEPRPDGEVFIPDVRYE